MATTVYLPGAISGVDILARGSVVLSFDSRSQQVVVWPP
jgi:hypothetical protein